MSTNNCNNNCTNSFGVCAKNNWCRTPIPAEYDTKLTVVEQIAKLNSVVNQILCMLDCNGDCGSGCSPCGPSNRADKRDGTSSTTCMPSIRPSHDGRDI